MEKSKQISRQPAEDNVSPIKYWGTITIGALGALVNIFLLRAAFQLPDATISYLARAFHSLVIFAGTLMILLTLRGRQKWGAQVAFYTVITLFTLGSFLYAESVISASFSFMTIAAIIISQLLPKELRLRSIILTGIALIIMWVAAWINPAWRLQPLTVAASGLVTAILFAIILVAIVIRLAWNTITSNIRIKSSLWFGLLVTGLSIVLVAYSIITGRQAAIQSAEAEALAISKAQAENVSGQIDPALGAARTLASNLGVVKDPAHPTSLTRDQANAMLRKVAEENPSFLGTWTIWEPNAFDGLDSQFVNAPLHDSTGRFIPYWVRVNGVVHGEAVKDYQTAGAGDFYLIPRQTRKETLLPPYSYEIDGKQVFLTTLAVPIVENGRFYGVAGVDLKIDSVQSIVDKINLYHGTASAVLVTDTGALIAVRNQPDQALKPATSIYPDYEQIRGRITADESFISPSPDGQYLRVFSPIIVGETGSHSSLSLIIPYYEIIAPIVSSAIQQTLISLGLILLSVAVLWYLTGQLTRPLVELTKVANEVSAGNLKAVADVKAQDEIGILAKSFNSMTARLQELLQSLEERVVARTRNLELAARVGHAVSQVRELDVMLKDACELILKDFGLYYVQVYLTDPAQTILKLEAGTGNVGAQLMEQGHSLPLDTASINGRAAFEKRSIMISDTAQSATFRKNPLLPDTCGEMAVPLIVADRVVGVLDMQSDKAGALTEESLPAFEALAGQLAVAIQNAHLLEEAQQARAQVEAHARRLVQKGWNEHLDGIHKPETIGYVFENDQVTALTEPEQPELNSMTNKNNLAVPLSVSGAKLGTLVVDMDEQKRSAESEQMIAAVARQMAQQIENLRLLESAERYRAEAERVIRLQTAEGWQEYLKSRPGNKLGFLYDLKKVHPCNNGHDQPETLTLPIKVRDVKVGKLAVQGLSAEDKQAYELTDVVTERLGAHIESLRQFDQTQNALALSEKLFKASSQISQAADLQELVAAVVTTLNVPTMNRANITRFEYAPSGEIDGLTIIANWWNGSGHEVTPIGTRYPREVLRVMIPMFVSPVPVFFNDTFNDERVEATTLELVVKELNLRSVAILPLYSSNQQIGALVLEGEVPYKFTQEEMRLFTSLAPQIATIMENRRQYEETQLARAQSEKLFNISQWLTQAANLQELVKTVAESLNIPVVSRALLDVFNYSAAGDLESMDVAATWWNGVGREPIAVGTHISANDLRVMKIFLTPTPLFFEDFLRDERVDEATLQLVKNLGLRSGAVLPLYAGSKQLGILFLQAEEPHKFTTEEIRLFGVLAPQIATILENRRQFEQAQLQAQREQALSHITSAVRGSTNPATILRTAARELGTLLGRKTIIRMTTAAQTTDQAEPGEQPDPAMNDAVGGDK